MKWWPFKKKEKVEFMDPAELNYSQVDITETFDQHLSLSKDEWVETQPINRRISGKTNLPAVDASDDEVFGIASELSAFREHFQIPDDGVYCPICHIANIDIQHLPKPCPRCGRPLLAFGWS